jgi:5-(carboxyamino)imidazole ribonucleotide mutase
MNNQRPSVGVIMGSDSDWPTMKKACALLDKFHISYEKKVVSAHRTPDMMADYGREARNRGLKVIIAGAGGAAHLPGMTAAYTTLPVIGVPIKTSTLNGLDSLYSIVQMPPGVPVATVAIGKAKNAGLLAARILSTSDKDIAEQLSTYHEKMAEESRAKTKNLN